MQPWNAHAMDAEPWRAIYCARDDGDRAVRFASGRRPQSTAPYNAQEPQWHCEVIIRLCCWPSAVWLR